MPKSLPLLLLATLCACTHSPVMPTPTPAHRQHATPEEAVQAYFRASDTRSSQTLRSAFHPSALMLQVERDGGALRRVTQLEWWQRLDSSASPPQPATERHLKVLDREGPLALVEAVSRWPGHAFDDLMLLVETPGGWRIVGKAFERIEVGEQLPSVPSAEGDIRAVLARKIEAHAAYSPALLHQTHTPDCPYYRVHVKGIPFDWVTLSEAAAGYADHQSRGETDRESPWRILAVEVRGSIAAAKLDVVFEGVRYIDHLLLVRERGTWRIAAAAWGDPKAGGR
ncbi:nuclear transport factor 2 family protein [Myxococcus sp. RHSTA-1-4]|uniref:nuclear transport factor 2 family protein n=1 Tax=Myxococcus sp. RHSTA-1-4 TaxID=2874601 RepID=UPI001CBF941A|nr:nuclear transport factor 2 family protein [Myxococcus sp. RHSTA-1-4]MBZ4422360.1 nuclear transport factor 2 family protein [Myxococcus sp. RHSTA-1-4]